VGVPSFERALQRSRFVKKLLEPEFIDLGDGDEQQLIVLGAIAEGLLKLKQLVHLQV
jgi:hypothetical protein